GMLLYQIGRLDEALAKAQECLAITPAYATGHLVSGLALEQQGRLREAIQAFERCVATNRNDLRCPAAIGHAHALAGRRAEAERMLGEIEHAPASAYSPQFLAAIVYAGLGLPDDTLRMLEAAYRDHEFDTPLMGADPRFKPLRNDQRFQSLLKRVGI